MGRCGENGLGCGVSGVTALAKIKTGERRSRPGKEGKVRSINMKEIFFLSLNETNKTKAH